MCHHIYSLPRSRCKVNRTLDSAASSALLIYANIPGEFSSTPRPSPSSSVSHEICAWILFVARRLTRNDWYEALKKEREGKREKSTVYDGDWYEKYKSVTVSAREFLIFRYFIRKSGLVFFFITRLIHTHASIQLYSLYLIHRGILFRIFVYQGIKSHAIVFSHRRRVRPDISSLSLSWAEAAWKILLTGIMSENRSQTRLWRAKGRMWKREREIREMWC